MHQSTVSATGRTTVPAAIRQQMGAIPGSVLAWHVMDDGPLMVQVRDKDVRELRGMFKAPAGKRVTVAQMNPARRAR